MRTAIVIPYRAPVDSPRERVWQHLQPLWHDTLRALGGTDLIVVDDGAEPFSVPRLVNGAVRGLDHDIIMLYGSDQYPHEPAIREARDRIEAGQPWTHVFGSVSYLTASCTERILAGETPVREYAETMPLAPGLLMYRLDVWTDVGGYDERMIAWGYSDTAQIDALNTLHPIPAGYPDHELVELHVPVSGWALQRDRTHTNPNRVLWENSYVPARGDRAAMRRVVDGWR